MTVTSNHLQRVRTAPAREPCLTLPVRHGTRRWIHTMDICVGQEKKSDARASRGGSGAGRSLLDPRAILDFLNMAVHDLTQPVQSLELAIGQIERKAATGGAGAELAAAHGSVARMRELLKMLLEICRIESGAVRLDEQPLPVAEMFEYLERQFAPQARAKGLAFTCEPGTHVIRTDAVFLRSMLANLVSNAIRYTRDGQVRLRARPGARGALCLEVSDTGIGIASGELERIFEDFRRLDEARRATSAGFGLGLGIVRRVSRVLGLPVTVQSRIGLGSSFRVEIPSTKVFAAGETVAEYTPWETNSERTGRSRG